MTSWDALEETYQNVEVKELNYKPLPDGDYQARIIKNQFDAGKWVLEQQFEIISGEHLGRKPIHRIHLAQRNGDPNEVAASILKGQILKFTPDYNGLPLKDVLYPYLLGSLNHIVDIHIKNKEGVRADGAPTVLTNIYINEFLNLENDIPF